jgi:hypothetical protein
MVARWEEGERRRRLRDGVKIQMRIDSVRIATLLYGLQRS